MTPERYKELNGPYPLPMRTREEIAQGWHWCYDWDFLLTTNKPEHSCGYTTCNCSPTPTNNS